MEMAWEIVEDEETRLVNTLRSTLENLPPSRTEGCIYRVSLELRRVNEEAYTPMLVSIGPFHHGKESLQEMEVHKQRYLKDFLKRTTAYDLEYYVRTLKSFEERARNCYAEDIHYSSNDFIKMMLLDGCFIVEFFLKYWCITLRNKDDPIFKNYDMFERILRDMALLENQLPFFILVHLFNTNVEIEFQRENSFHKIALNVMNDLTGFSAEVILPDENTDQAKHMVDLCLLYYTPMVTKLSPKTERGIFLIPNASRLRELGVKFRKCTRYGVKCLLDVKFRNGNLEIPTVKFQDHTETFLRNFIAYEQCNMGNSQFFSEYISLMDCLIDTPNDVELLTKAGIINFLGDNGEVAEIFNKLGSGVKFTSNFYLRRLSEDVMEYCNTPWHVWRATVMRNFCRSMSVAVAVILLLLPIPQFFVSILQFFFE